MSRPTQIKLMPEYGVELPLWSEQRLVEGDIGLSADLDAELRSWANFFERHFKPETGWDVPAHG